MTLKGFRKTTLAEVLDFFNGKMVKPNGEGVFPVYGSNGIIGGSDEFKYENAIIIGRVGAYCGSVEYCAGKFWASDNTIVARTKSESDVRFFFYLLRNLNLHSYAGGAAQPLVTQSVLNQVPATIPSFSTQRKIAAILSAYDDLIENNTRRIKILEEMAQMLYREWFVNFRFPSHEKVRMVNSRLGKVPEEWERKTIGDVLSVIESGSRPKGGIDPIETEVPSIGAENIIGLGKYNYSNDRFVSRAFFDSMTHGHIQSEDVLLYKDGAHIGKKSMFRDGFPHKECCINEHVFILRTDETCTQNYLFFWLDQPTMTQNIRNLNANAAQPGINQLGVKGLPILLPNQSTLEKFEELVDPILALLFNLAKKVATLRRTRDLLLPKLISSEVDVEGLDIPVR